MIDELCARPGCGAPKAWHSPSTPIGELGGMRPTSHYTPIRFAVDEGACIGCTCPAYLAPEPPQPERNGVFVVEDEAIRLDELLPDTRLYFEVSELTPLAEFLASHPQPAPRLCICGGDADDHHPVTGRCEHVAKRWWSFNANDEAGLLDAFDCYCRKFREAQP